MAERSFTGLSTAEPSTDPRPRSLANNRNVVHIVTDPEGREHEITGPADATPETVIAAARHLIGKQGAPRGGSALPEPGQPEPGRFGPRAIEPGSTAESINEVGKTLIPLLAGAGAGGLVGKGVSMATKAAPRLLPAVGRTLGTGAVSGAQTEGDLSDKVWGGVKGAGSAGVVEAALPFLAHTSRILKALKGIASKEGPGVTNVHVKSAPPEPTPTLVQTPSQIAQARNLGTARQAVGAPARPPAPGIADPHNPDLNIVDVIRSRYGIDGLKPAGPAVSPALQTGADALAGTETGEAGTMVGGVTLLQNILQRLGIGGGGQEKLGGRSIGRGG